jgi:hypothetical protein
VQQIARASVDLNYLTHDLETLVSKFKLSSSLVSPRIVGKLASPGRRERTEKTTEVEEIRKPASRSRELSLKDV